jgi:hypothetical protein
MSTTTETSTNSSNTDGAAPVTGSSVTPQSDSSGFYRLDGQSLQFAANEVHAPGYTLTRSSRASTALPKDGWDWFDSAEAAYAHHNLPQPQPEQPGRPRRPEPRAAGGSGR